MNRYSLSLTLASSLLISGLHAATINWDAFATTISGDSDISTQGTTVYALNLGGSNITVNGVSFTSVNTLNGNSNLTTTKYNNTNLNAFGDGGGATAFGSLSVGYQELLDGAHFAAASIADGPAVITLNNLIDGQQYQVQLWLNDSRANTRVGSISGGPSLTYNSTGSVGGVGQYAIGTFTADATTQSFSLSGDTVDTGRQLNAIQLRAVPEPSTYALVAGALALSSVMLRRRRKC